MALSRLARDVLPAIIPYPIKKSKIRFEREMESGFTAPPMIHKSEFQHLLLDFHTKQMQRPL
jgi:hypothetical protein